VTYEICIVGIPLVNCVNPDFKKSIESINSGNIGFCLADFPTKNYSELIQFHKDFINATFGYKILLEELDFVRYTDTLYHGKINTFGDLWGIISPDGRGRNPELIAKYLIEIFDTEYNKCKFDKVFIFTPGNPKIDTIPKELCKLRNISFIEAVSPIELAAEFFKTKLNVDCSINYRNFYRELYKKENPVLNSNELNIFYGISDEYYKKITNVFDKFIDTLADYLNPDDIFFLSTVTEDGYDYMVMKYSEVEKHKSTFREKSSILTYGVYKNDNSRSISPLIS
jgi:hypothetical protein